MKWRDVFLVTVAAALMFGGTFTCVSSSDDDDDDGKDFIVFDKASEQSGASTAAPSK